MPPPALNNPGYTASWTFDSTIASAGNDKKSFTNTTAYALRVLALMGNVAKFAGANSNNNIAAYGPEAGGAAAQTGVCGRHMFRVRFEGSSTGPWHDNTNGVKYSSLLGSANNPMYFAVPFVILPGETVTCQLFNDSGDSVRDQIDAICERVA